jgi:hypothetical protein
MHNRPTISQTILLQNMYQNPVINAPLGPDGLPLAVDPAFVTEFYEVRGHEREGRRVGGRAFRGPRSPLQSRGNLEAISIPHLFANLRTPRRTFTRTCSRSSPRSARSRT